MLTVISLVPGSRVRVRATGVEGVVVEVSRRHRTVDLDLGDGITAEFTWDEVDPVLETAPAG